MFFRSLQNEADQRAKTRLVYPQITHSVLMSFALINKKYVLRSSVSQKQTM